MHDSLGKFLEENKAAFDSHVPSPELWGRIAAQSPEIKKATKKQTMFVFGRIAAAAVVVLVLAFGWQMYYAKSPVTDEFAAQYAPLDEEVKEAAMYYEVEIERKSQQVFELTSNQPAIREGVEMDMAELDEVLNQLKNDLKDNVSNAEVLAAMIQNYRLKLDILEQILEYVEQKDDNTNENIVIHEL